MYVYIRSEKQLWTVGFYTPDGEWVPESDYDCMDDAAERVHFLNGGGLLPAPLKAIKPKIKGG